MDDRETDDAVVMARAREILQKHLGQTDVSMSGVGDALYWYLVDDNDLYVTLDAMNELDQYYSDQTEGE